MDFGFGLSDLENPLSRLKVENFPRAQIWINLGPLFGALSGAESENGLRIRT